MLSLLLVALVVLLLALGAVFVIRRRRTGTGPVGDVGDMSPQPGEARRDIRAYHRFSSGGGDPGLGRMDQERR